MLQFYLLASKHQPIYISNFTLLTMTYGNSPRAMSIMLKFPSPRVF